MSIERSPEYLVSLVSELRRAPKESDWLEFKQSNSNPEEIGDYIAALANAAALADKANAYVVWGIEDATRAVVGTTFRPFETKKGGQELLSWLSLALSPRVHFRFYEVEYEGRSVVLLEIPRANSRPVQFQGVERIRIGSYRQALKEHPEHERALWRVFDRTPFEALVVAEHLGAGDVVAMLDFESFFSLQRLPVSADFDRVAEALAEDGMITRCEAGGWNITALGAVLFARNLDAFAMLKRKAVRLVVYDGNSRLQTTNEIVGRRGYASGFAGLMQYLNGILPRNEVIGQAFRKDAAMYPELAIRELAANALVHQDFGVTGAGPMIEVFGSRMEITNPGRPLVSTSRFLDTPPRSRNETLASFMRRIGVCEERGSGIDKVVFQTELFQLPAPIFETVEESTRTVLFAYRTLREMDRDDRIRAAYLHACLRYVEREQLTNASLRQRFGIEEHNSAIASRIIGETVEAGWVKPYDPDQSKRFARYVPFWA